MKNKSVLGMFLAGYLLILVIPKAAMTAKVLCTSHQFGSHMLMVHSAAEELITRGHEVYTIFSDKMSVPADILDKGFKVIRYHTPEWSDIFGSQQHADNVFEAALGGGAVNHSGDSLLSCRECYDMDNDTNFMQTLESLHFDIVVTDTFPLCNCLYFIPLKLGIPFIPVIPIMTLEITRVPVLPSFNPLPFGEFTDKMSFFERVRNTIGVITLSSPYLTSFPGIKDTTLLDKYNKDPSVTSWTQLGRKASLFLLPRGPVLEYITPFMPHVVNIECLTCKPAKPLTSDMANLIDKHNGIIVVSFGSLIDRLPDEITEQFLQAFESRNELVYWRYAGQLPRSTKSNVKVMKWMPQNDLLAHPKTKLFITHGGNNGQYESVYHGVPMLVFPLFAEQHHNAKRIVLKGFGLFAVIRTVTADELKNKISEIIDNPFYRKNTQKASKMIKGVPMNARETSAHWIEHVLEYGSDHLRSPILDMNWYSVYMLDVLIFFQIIALFAICLIIFLIKLFWKCVFGKKDIKEKIN